MTSGAPHPCKLSGPEYFGRHHHVMERAPGIEPGPRTWQNLVLAGTPCPLTSMTVVSFQRRPRGMLGGTALASSSGQLYTTSTTDYGVVQHRASWREYKESNPALGVWSAFHAQRLLPPAGSTNKSLSGRRGVVKRVCTATPFGLRGLRAPRLRRSLRDFSPWHLLGQCPRSVDRLSTWTCLGKKIPRGGAQRRAVKAQRSAAKHDHGLGNGSSRNVML